MKKIMGLLVVVVLSLLAAASVFAAIGENAATSVGATAQLTESPANPGQAVAQGGNVTRVDLESNSSTDKWQGFYGNVSGTIQLGSGANVLYDFGDTTVTAVYASQDQNFNWATLQITTQAQVDTAFGFNTAADVDQAVDVFDATISIDGLINTPSTALEDGNFNTFLVDDGSNAVVNDFAFGAEVQNAGAVGFDGSTWEYELLVPIDAGTPTYYFFMSI